MNKMEDNRQLSDELKDSDAYKMGEAIGNMVLSKSHAELQTNLNVQFVKESGLMQKDFSSIGVK